MTDAEQKLWIRLRRKQINGWQFYRQKPIGSYIVDFYCPTAKLVIEVDGSQHLDPPHQSDDQRRDTYLANLGLRVLRFDNRQVLLETESVVEAIAGIPPVPPLIKGGAKRLPTKSPPLVNECIPPFTKGGIGGIPRTTATKGEGTP
jgi:very-short-patch-repair endonuclease